MANSSDLLVETILSWGIDTVFGIPGDGINGIMEALRTHKDKIRFVQTRHEESAAFMACAYAKYTGRLGCCLATSGPGAIHLLNGLYDAKMDQAPVLAITGQTFSDLQGSMFQQDVNLVQLFSDVAVFNQEVISPDQVKLLTDEACRVAVAQRCVAHLNFPVDYQVEELSKKTSIHNVPGHTNNTWDPPIIVPNIDDLTRAAAIINAGKKPVILAGQGALHAGDEIIVFADKIGAPVVKALLGKAVIPDDHPLTTGGLGLLGTTPSQEAMEECDTLIMVGTSFPYMEFLPDHDQARGIQIDIKPERIGLRYPVEVGLVGDARITLQQLIKLVNRNENRSFLDTAQRSMLEWWKNLEEQALEEREPIKPQRIAWELSKLAADDAIISGDSGTNTAWVARYFKQRRNQMFSCSGTLATMACGLPYAIAAKLAFPERQSIAFVGDGGFTMLMGEFATAVKYHLPITVIIVKNNVLGQIKWEQIVFLGNPEYGVELPDISFSKFAEACGGRGIYVSHPSDIAPALREALRSSIPTVVEVLVDPLEAPMPSKVTFTQATHFAEALARGQKNGPQIALTMFRDKLNEVL